jgi:putative transposase
MKLERELDEHLKNERLDPAAPANSRNGVRKKTLKTELGEASVSVPRDRNGTFKPKIIAKRQTRMESVERIVSALYAQGMSTRKIEEYMKSVYGIGVSSMTVSGITDKLLPEMREWRSRPLDEIYPVVFCDGVYFKGKSDGQAVKKCAYSVLGVTMEGKKEILGAWIADSESASFWASVLNDLKSRGVKDILVTCHDNLTGFGKALEAVYPKADSQLCIVHQVRSSMAYAGTKDRKKVADALKPIYRAADAEEGFRQLEIFEDELGRKFPAIIKSWKSNWSELSTFFRYPPELRKLIYTTNPVESYHGMVRKYMQCRDLFPTDDAIMKSIYMAVKRISLKWTHSVRDWHEIYGQLMIFFEERLRNVKIDG